MAQNTAVFLDNSTFTIQEGISVTSGSNVYQILRILRYRVFGEIAECINEKTGEILTIKFVKNKCYSQDKREVDILQQLKTLHLQERNIANFVECFSYKDRICFVYEKLENNFLEKVTTDGKSIHLTEIRSIAYQMFVALTALHNSGITHANIKPENIMRVDGFTQQYGVKLTGFSHAAKTSELSDLQIPLACGYSAPEIYLDCPLDQSLDIWSLGFSLAYLFLGKHLSSVDCEYRYMQFISDVLGDPEKHILDKGRGSRRFFKQEKLGSNYIWRLKTQKEFIETTGSEIKRIAYNNFTCLDDLLFEHKQSKPIVYDDIETFIDLLKKMIQVNPANRIKPADALNHPFITMKHLRFTSDTFYLTESQRIMESCQYRKTENVYTSLSTPNVENPRLNLSKEAKENSSHFVHTQTRKGTSSIKKLTKTTGETKEISLPGPGKIPPSNNDLNQLLGDEKCDEESCGKKLSVKTRTIETPLGKATERGIDDTDMEQIYVTHTNKKTLEIKPGLTIKGNSKVYLVEDKLGAGSYGEVAKCRIEGTNELVALKIIRKTDENESFNESKTLQLLKNLKNPNDYFIGLNGCFTYQDCFCEELELLDKSLLDYFCDGGVLLKVAEIRVIAQQMLITLSAMKRFGITHADIKNDNIVFANQDGEPFRIKLIDFRLACETKDLSQEKLYQSVGFRAPEVILGLPRDEAIDTWSLGCVLSYLFTRVNVFPTENQYDNLRLIMKLCGEPDKKLLDKGTLVSQYFTKQESGSEPSWRFKTLDEYQKKNGKVFLRAHTGYDRLKSLDHMVFSQNTHNSTEIEDLNAFIDLVKKMLTIDPAERILPADALNHPFLTMNHLDEASDRSYVRRARSMMKHVQYRIPGNISPEDTPRPGPSKISPNHEGINELLSDERCDEATSVKRLSVKTRKVETKKRHLDSSPLEEATEREIDKDLMNVTLTPLKLMPGMTIQGKSKVYFVEEELGAGTFGVVFRCRIVGTDKRVALKMIRERNAFTFFNEAKTLEHLNKLKHYKNYFIRLNDCFTYKDCFYLELELLDDNLLRFFLRNRDATLRVAELRVITKQMLVALSAFKQLGIVHTDIKPDNIMLVDHEKQPLRVKLIDFGCASKTQNLPQEDLFQPLGFRAPEVILGLPRDEAVDMWSLGCVLADLFTRVNVFPTENKHDNLRLILKLCGEPSKKLLEKGTLVSQYFIKQQRGSETSWKFKSYKQYQKEYGKQKRASLGYYFVKSLDNLILAHTTNNSTENTDIKAFLDLVKKMLTVNPDERIQPADALKHPFITMEHLDKAPDRRYVRIARSIMKNTQWVQPGNVPPEGERENISCPGPSEMLSDPIDLNSLLPKAEFDESASSSEFNPEEVMRSFYKECNRREVTGKTSIDYSKGTTRSAKKDKTVSCEEGKDKLSQFVQTETDNAPLKFRPVKGNSKVYIIEDKLGAGEYGEVARCHIEGTNKLVALKVMWKRDAFNFYNEVTILQHLNNLKHYNNYIIRLNDCFAYKDCFFQEIELLDKDLLDYSLNRGFPFKVAEFRAITQQMLLALSAFKQLGIVHTDIKPDNIMLVDHEKQPFRVKLIDFGSAYRTKHLPQEEMLQNLGYRAPEVILGLPRDEAIDTWSLGCVLADLFTGVKVFPLNNKYDNLRLIMKLLGKSDIKALEKGTLVSQYFIKQESGSEPSWRLKTPDEYQKNTGEVIERADPAYDDVASLDDLFLDKTNSSTESKDIKVFLDLVKKMLTMNPAERIRPADALKHPFITMEHLDETSDKSYVTNARRIMKHVQCRQSGNVPLEGERENTPRSGPSDPIDLDGSLPMGFDESASCTNFNPKELVLDYIEEKNGKIKTDVKKKTFVARVKNFFTRKVKFRK